MSEIQKAFWHGFVQGAGKAGLMLVWPVLVLVLVVFVVLLGAAVWPFIPFGRLVWEVGFLKLKFSDAEVSVTKNAPESKV